MTPTTRRFSLALFMFMLMGLGCFINHRADGGECELNQEKTCEGKAIVSCSAQCLGSETGRCEEPQLVRTTCSNGCVEDGAATYCAGTCRGPKEANECINSRTIRTCQRQTIPDSGGQEEYNWVEEECQFACDSNFGNATCTLNGSLKDETPDLPVEDSSQDMQMANPDNSPDASIVDMTDATGLADQSDASSD